MRLLSLAGCLAMAGISLAAQGLAVSRTAIAFGAQPLGTASPIQPVVVANTGAAAVTITGWTLSGGGFSLYSADALPLTLAPGASTEVNLQFQPTAAQAYSGVLSVASNSGGGPSVGLSGSGALPALAISGATNFGSQAAGTTGGLQTLYLENTGAIAVEVTGITLASTAFSIYSHAPLPATLNPGEMTGVTVSFSPASAGAYAAVLAAQGSAPASAVLTGTGTGGNGLAVTTPAIELATNVAASASLQAAGGTPPYHWSLYWSSAPLPAGLTLSADGVLSGTPTASGTSEVIVAAGDASNPTQWVTQTVAVTVLANGLDAYGGAAGQSCPAGPAAHFYPAQVNGRWWLCTPAGNVFWMRGVYDAAATDTGVDYQGVAQAELVQAKYAAGPTSVATLNWALQTARRLQAWGFNTLGEYALGWVTPAGVNSQWGTADSTIPVKLPFVGFESPSLYALTNSGNYAAQPTKDLVAGVSPAVYAGYRATSPDVFDPNWGAWLTTALAQDGWAQAAIHGPHSDYLVGFNIDDTDNLLGFGAGADFPTVSNGVMAPGNQQPHLGWMVLVTAPTQGANASLGESYSDPTVYAKRALSQWLAARYGNSIAALDAAWGAGYSSFGSAGGWGVGTGLLDENGACPAAHGGACWVPADAYGLQGATAAMRQDLDGYLLYHAQQYFGVIRAALQAAAPGVLYLGPTSLGSWGTPPRQQILQAAAQYADVLMLASLPPDCSNCNDSAQRLQFVTQFAGSKPWVNWEGYQAKADSYMAPYAAPGDELASQAARGQLYQARLQAMMAVPNLVGLKWWALYDSRGEQANWGLLTNRDDAYDGSARPAAGVDAWGYPSGCVAGFGCEQASYGNFLAAVAAANLAVYATLLP